MKLFFVFLFVCICTSGSARNYYFSTQSGDDSRSEFEAQNSATPWKTLNKHNGFNYFKPGDSILFKRGEVFDGVLFAHASGTIKNVIFYGSYAYGVNPVISGLTTISGWTLSSDNIYYATLNVPTLNLVILDGMVKGLGRFPNTGWLNYEAHTANTSITDTQLNGNTDWTSGEVAIRKYRWIIDRHTISANSRNKITYTANSHYGNNNAYEPVDGNGYFIQNHLGTLDQLGEWFYDNAANRIYMHFGSGNPNLKVVRVSTTDRSIMVNSLNHITFNGLDIEGSNTHGAYFVGATNITVNNCNFRKQGGTGIYGIDVNNITINGGIISDALNNGIWIEKGGSYCTVNNVALSNIGTIAGAGRSGDGGQDGISVSGSNTTITNCSVTNTGYNGINVNGNDLLIEKNIVETFCTVKDDGGGIYTYEISPTINNNRIIRNNSSVSFQAANAPMFKHWL